MASNRGQLGYNIKDPNLRRELERQGIVPQPKEIIPPKPQQQIIESPKFSVDSPDRSIEITNDGPIYHTKVFNYATAFEQYGFLDDDVTDETTISDIGTGNSRQLTFQNTPDAGWIGFYTPNEIIDDNQGWIKHLTTPVKHSSATSRKLTYFQPLKTGVYNIDLGIMVKIIRVGSNADCAESNYLALADTVEHIHINSILLDLIVINYKNLDSIIAGSNLSSFVPTSIRSHYNERINKTYAIGSHGIDADIINTEVLKATRRQMLTANRNIFLNSGEIAIPIWKINEASHLSKVTVPSKILLVVPATIGYICQLHETFHIHYIDSRLVGTNATRLPNSLTEPLASSIIHKLL